MNNARSLVCVYLCERDAWLLPAFFASPYGRLLRDAARYEVLEVYASADLAAPLLEGNRLTIAAPEIYSQLSLKTYEMLHFCCAHATFSRLVKIDVTCALSEAASPGPATSADITRVLCSPGPADYEGIWWHGNPQRQDIDAWAAQKGGRVDLGKVFGDHEPMPSWFSGKCYALSRRFAQYVCETGRPMAEEHARFLMGSEDMMIGRLYANFLRSRGAEREAAATGPQAA